MAKIVRFVAMEGEYQRWIGDDADHYLIRCADAPADAEVGDRGVLVYAREASGAWHKVRKLRRRAAASD